MPSACEGASFDELRSSLITHVSSRCINGCEYMKVKYLNCGLRREYESDLRSYKHYLNSSEDKT